MILVREPSLNRYRWNFVHVHQWHSLAYVLEEVTRRPDAQFAQRLWQVVDLVFSEPDVLKKHGATHRIRDELLAAHGKALQARERMLEQRSNISRSINIDPVFPYQSAEPNQPPISHSSGPAMVISKSDVAEDMFWPSRD